MKTFAKELPVVNDIHPVTVLDIARKARVSPATVSRAFNPAQVHRVNDKTRERVIKVAQKLGYQPNRFARALSGGMSDTVAIILPPTMHVAKSIYDMRVIAAAASALQEATYDLKVHFLREEEKGMLLRDLRTRLGVDGLIIAGVPSDYRFAHDTSGPIPAVFLNSYLETAAFSIDADNIHGGRMVADYFISRGHVEIGMLCGPGSSRNAVDRAHGFRQQITAAALKVNPGWFIECDYDSAAGYMACRNILKQPERPTALFCASDEIALGALQAINDEGSRCPDDISLVGFDNAAAIAHTRPPLTTVEQPIETMAQQAVEKLLRIPHEPLTASRLVFPVTLIERESVKTIK